jgi:hypothetical protein
MGTSEASTGRCDHEEEPMSDDRQYGADTPTGTDPDEVYTEPGYQDVSLGQAVNRDAELVDRLAADTDDIGEAERRFSEEATGRPKLGDRSGGDDLGADDSRRLLELYLSDHRGAAAAAVEVARRTRASNRQTEFSSFLSGLHDDLIEDREALDRIIRRLGIETQSWKPAVSWLGAKLGELKPSGRLLKYSPLSRVLEAETLIMAIEGKKHLWDVLRFAGSGSDGSQAAELDRLSKRASSQLESLRRYHREAALIAFGTIEIPADSENS